MHPGRVPPYHIGSRTERRIKVSENFDSSMRLFRKARRAFGFFDDEAKVSKDGQEEEESSGFGDSPVKSVLDRRRRHKKEPGLNQQEEKKLRGPQKTSVSARVPGTLPDLPSIPSKLVGTRISSLSSIQSSCLNPNLL